MRIRWTAALVLALAGWAGPPVWARPAHKQALADYFGPALAKPLNDCKTCHISKANADDPENPHNFFGTRLRQTRYELRKQSKPAGIIDRLEAIAEEDSDGDGVANMIELITGHFPGKARDVPSAEEAAKGKEALAAFKKKRALTNSTTSQETSHMATAPRAGPITFDEFCVLIRPEQKADLIDGVIYMASPENIDSHRLFRWLYTLMGDFAEAKDLGEVFGSRIAFRLGAKVGPEPDIAVVRKDRLHLARKSYFAGPPDLAVEIVSPESVERDYVTKRATYQEAGVAEYWIIDEEPRKALLLRPDRKGEYREVRAVKGEFKSLVLDGFRLRPAWLWQTPRPSRVEILAEMLQGKGV